MLERGKPVEKVATADSRHVVTEVCVKFAAFGLLATGKRVEIVTDAICPLDEKKGAEVLAEFTAAGGHLTHSGIIYA